ncbi:MAG: hypothetical protein HY720_14730 [Planctomycetes bacterium]|nr:hypothetical protein [Planctomycetota bacterium]
MGASLPSSSPLASQPEWRDLIRWLESEGQQARSFFGVRGPILFWDEGSDSPNAKALSPDDPSGPAVLIGIRLTLRLRNYSVETQIPLQAIIGHEYGHQYQYQRIEMLGERFVYRDELIADYLAGAYLRSTGASPKEASYAARIVFGLGGTDFNNPQHHGTHAQRAGALRAGYESGRLP